MKMSLLSLLNHSGGINKHLIFASCTRQIDEAIKRLLINWIGIFGYTLAFAHFDAICRQIFASINIAFGYVKDNSIQLDFVANVKIFPRIKRPRMLWNLPTSHQPALRQTTILSRHTEKKRKWRKFLRDKTIKFPYLYNRFNNCDCVIFQIIENVDVANAVMFDARLWHVLPKEAHEFQSLLIKKHKMWTKRWRHLLLRLRSTVD